MPKRASLEIGENRDSVYFLGYRLKLTPIEYRILRIIDEKGEIATRELIESVGLHDVLKGNLAVHICAINRKAKIICTRKLILYKNARYLFNEDI